MLLWVLVLRDAVLGLEVAKWYELAICVPCLLVPLALGLYKVPAWCSSLVSYGPWYVLTVNRGPEKNLLAWGEFRKGTSSMHLVELVTLVLFAGEEEDPDLLHVDLMQRLSVVLESPVVNDLREKACWAQLC